MADLDKNIIVKQGDRGFAVEDVQDRLARTGYLMQSEADGIYGERTNEALLKFCDDNNLDGSEGVTNEIWVRLVDSSFSLGDRSLYLNMPYFHGNDVAELQRALGALGFSVYHYDGIFGTHTEQALRRFQINMGLPSDGIAGSATYEALEKLRFTWGDKKPVSRDDETKFSVWRTPEVLENNEVCIFGVDDFTRDVSRRISNLSRATNPFSRVLCPEQCSVAPGADAYLLQIIAPVEDEDGNIDYEKAVGEDNVPAVFYVNSDEQDSLSGYEGELDIRIFAALRAVNNLPAKRIKLMLPSKQWSEAGFERTAQHFAITILDNLCNALDKWSDAKNGDK